MTLAAGGLRPLSAVLPSIAGHSTSFLAAAVATLPVRGASARLLVQVIAYFLRPLSAHGLFGM